MRATDVAEILASSGGAPLPVLEQALLLSQPAHLITFQGKALAIGGIVPFSDIAACPWQLCTHDADHHGKGLIRLGRQAITHWLTRFEHLGNMVDARNKQSIKWLRYMGFAFSDPVPHGAEGMPFIPFSISRSAKNV